MITSGGVNNYTHEIEDVLPALAAELSAYAAQRLARYRLPNTIDFLDALPRRPTSKLSRKALRDEYLARAAAPA